MCKALLFLLCSTASCLKGCHETVLSCDWGNGEGFPSANWDLMPASVQLFFKAKNLSLLKVKTIVVHYYKSQCEGCIM